ncbi:MAG: hypothetical protein JSR98_03275, partial [Proteobacteria bacterium]|nr:hypothetical protein [Pseudomonadota bacterium]
MQTAKRRHDRGWAVAASVVAHVVLLTIAAFQSPKLKTPTWEGGPPEPIIPVMLLPRTPEPAAGPTAPQRPIRLHRRPQPFAPTPVAPLPVPAPEAKAAPAVPAEPKAVPTFHPAPLP